LALHQHVGCKISCILLVFSLTLLYGYKYLLSKKFCFHSMKKMGHAVLALVNNLTNGSALKEKILGKK